MTIPVMLISVVVFGLAVFGMAVGVIFGNRRIRGSCGGVGGRHDVQGEHHCQCAQPDPACPNRRSDIAE